MPHWIDACATGDIDEADLIRFDHGGATFAIYHSPDGKFYATAGKWLADLPALARMRLKAVGVTQIFGNDSAPPWCTVGNPLRFFSHRRDNLALGGSGRMAACIWIDGGAGLA